MLTIWSAGVAPCKRLLAAFDGAAAMRGRTHLRMAPEAHIAATVHIRRQRAFGPDPGIAAAVHLRRDILDRQRANIRIAAAMHRQRKARLFREAAFGFQVAAAMDGNGRDGRRRYLDLELVPAPAPILATVTGRQQEPAVVPDFDL